ncbi:fasciclin-2-like isoform X3 [Portunus trituberculatus]|nr:fasciclin-2-like isoform X3 [Portunus trituberculatus]XP_045121117.1 fasciclin-2-like isoform X3 [Portunus trituberculatus]XP_045121118.1 fasciclin-2-like isoform X3 [Portunus trituberculatus]
MANQRHLILLSLLAVQVSLAQEPRLVIQPNSILKAVGDGAYVSCMAQVDDADLVTEMSWTAPDGERITNNNENSRIRVSTAEDGTTGKLDLVITKLREQDVGEYTCSATYAGNKKLEARIEVESFMEIDFGDTPSHQTLLIGQEGRIKCTPMAKPPPIVDWFKNIAPLRSEDNRIIQQDGIHIKEVTEADEGTYRCRAKVPALGSMKQMEIQVEVNIPPVINIPPQNITGKEHKEAVFECGATGKPAPEYSWVDNNNVPLENGDDFHVNTETGVLKIMNLRPEQSGEYRCTATNSAGEDFKTAHLQVYTKPKVEEYLNLTVQTDNDLMMKCVVSGNPPPQVIFKKESEPGNFTQGINTDDRIIVRQEKDDQGREVGILEITDVSRSDDGLYTCTAVSEGGVTQRWNHITVEFSPTFEEQGPTVQWSWEKAPVNLTCLATSIPNATIQWYLHKQEINANDPNLQRLELGPRGVLRVNPISSSYFGFYTCKATNTLGTSSLDIELKEAHPPGPITGAKVDKKTATTISWKLVDPADDGGLPIQSYIVEYREAEHTWEEAFRKIWNKGSSYTIDNLIPLATYVFRFAAQSKVGVGEWGGEKSEKMPGHAEPEEPLIFAAAKMEIPYSNHYELQWETPLNNGKEIDYFQILYYQVKKKGESWEAVGDKMTQEVPYPGTTSYKIEGLLSNSYYRIELRAHNDIGFSTPAEKVIKTAHDPKTPKGNGSGASVQYSSIAPSTTALVHGHDPAENSQESGPNAGVIVAVIIIVILVVAVVVDVTCYFTRSAGLIATIASKRGAKDKDKETMLEDGKNARRSSHEGIGKNPQVWRGTNVSDRSEEAHQAPLRLPQHHHITAMTAIPQHPPHPPGTEATQNTKPVIQQLHRKSTRKETAHSLIVTGHDFFHSPDENRLKNSTSSPLLDQSYSDDSIYEKVLDVTELREKPTTQSPHLTHSQELLAQVLLKKQPFKEREDNPFLHKATKMHPVSPEDMVYDLAEIPHPSRLVNLLLGSTEMLQDLQVPHYTFGSTEALEFGSSEVLSQPSTHLLIGSNGDALTHIIPPRKSEKYNDNLRMQSFLSNSREILNSPPRVTDNRPQDGEILNGPPRLTNSRSQGREMLNGPLRLPYSRSQGPPSVGSCSTHYQPTDAVPHQTQTQTAYRIAPYDDPIIPTRPPRPNPPRRQGKDALQNTKTQPFTPLPAARKGKKPPEKGSTGHSSDISQHTGLSLSMDTLDSAIDTRQSPQPHPPPLPTTRSLNNLLDDSSSSLRSYGKPTLL